jgi:hypothetical protein
MSAAYRGRIKIKRQPWQECPFDSGPSASRKDWRCFGRLNKRRTSQDLAEHFEAAGQAAAAILQANALPSTPVKHVLHLIEGAETLFLARMQLPNPKYLSLHRRGMPALTGSGRKATINNDGSKARGTTRRCEGWPSNGFASCSVAGKIGTLMTRADIWPRSPNETHPWLRSLVGQSREIFADTS